MVQVTNHTTITPTIAHHVLHFFGEDGYMSAGHFFSKLYEAAGHADSGNLNKLALAFPAEIGAFKIAKYNERGIEVLKEIAAR